MIYVQKNNQLEPEDLAVLTKENNIHSHKVFIVSCDLQSSLKCRKTYSLELRLQRSKT